jgi:deoxyribodipyrimidine photo-lyase
LSSKIPTLLRPVVVAAASQFNADLLAKDESKPVCKQSSKALVWFKRDLRVTDHSALVQASAADSAAALYIIEPQWLSSPECSARHIAFVLASLNELKRTLARIGLPLLVRQGPALDVLSDLRLQHAFDQLHSHEETGSGWTYERDIAVQQWCIKNNIAWHEHTQTGVIRRLKNRNGWAAQWAQRMNVAPADLSIDFRFKPLDGLYSEEVPTLEQLGVSISQNEHAALTTPAGELAAWEVLNSFLDGRGAGYRSAMSSPLSAEQGCSRLSAHLAYGTISMRSVHQATEYAIADYHSRQDRSMAYALRGFTGRLRWHCHFMQKLESEPAIEWHNFWRAADGIRPDELDDEGQRRFNAWCQGRTGYPMIDACMRYLKQTGWLNFRMRAMLVSFASYHLWLHWRITGVFLAQQFTDFEPGIHWSQMQMQSGTTGINTLRIYSPTKQGRDQDPQGVFIRRWCPELAHVPLTHIFEPWLMNDIEQKNAQCIIGKDYPAPIVNEKTALAFAQEQLYGLRKNTDAKLQIQHILKKHGSRKSGLAQTGKPRISKKSAAVSIDFESKLGAVAPAQSQASLF